MTSLGPSVLEGRLRYLSVSQLERFDSSVSGGCERKWWFRYVARIAEPQKAAAKLGEQVHAQIAHYLKTGEDVLGPFARALQKIMPQPGPDLMVEEGFHSIDGEHVVSRLTAGGVPFVGLIDLLHTRETYTNEDGASILLSGEAEIVDWKTTKSIEKYAKTSGQVASTWQGLGYAKAAQVITGRTDIRVGYAYTQTQGPRAIAKRSSVLSSCDIEMGWERAHGLVEKIASAAGEAEVTNVTANLQACNAYGGCAYKDRCPRDSKELLITLLGGKTMGLLDKLKAKEAAGMTPALAASAISPAVVAEIEKLKAEEAARITPPDMPAPEKIADEPEKTENVAAATEEKPAKKARAKKETPAQEPARNGLRLFVNCAPMREVVYSLDDYAAQVAKDLAEEYGVADVRIAGGDSPLGFGKWKGYLAIKMMGTLPSSGAYRCNMTEFGSLAFEVLSPVAVEVVS